MDSKYYQRVYELRAKNPCTMDGLGQDALTVGKLYYIHDFDDECIFIINDNDEDHCFEYKDIDHFFEIPEKKKIKMRL